MGKNFDILIAGFGGQGVLFTGKIMAQSALDENKQVSWLPSYGPEMRGGTCNCSVVISDELIGNPNVTEPNILIAMNYPSFEKFEKAVTPGGYILFDSSIIDQVGDRADVSYAKIPATELALEHSMGNLSNMIMLGKALKDTGFIGYDTIKDTLKATVPPSRAALLEANLKAIEIGYQY